MRFNAGPRNGASFSIAFLVYISPSETGSGYNMTLQINQRSLTGAISLAKSFFQHSKADVLDTVALKIDNHKLSFIISTQFSGMSASLIYRANEDIPEITVAFKDLQTALTALNPNSQQIYVQPTGDKVIFSDGAFNGSIEIPSIVPLGKHSWDIAETEMLGVGNCQVVGYVFDKALSMLPSIIPEYDGFYVYQTSDPVDPSVWGLTVDQSTCFKTTHLPLELLTLQKQFRIPTRLLSAVSTFAKMDKTELQLSIYKLGPDSVGARLGNGFWFHLLDDVNTNPKLKSAIEFTFKPAAQVIVNREDLLQNVFKMYKATTRNDSPQLTITVIDPTTIEVSVIQKPADIILSKKLKANIKGMLRPLIVTPLHLNNALGVFDGEEITISIGESRLVQLSGLDKDIVAYIQPYDDKV